MINTSQEHRRDRFEAVQAGRLSVYMEDMVLRLERLQRGETEEEEKSKMYTKKKQDLWDAQYLKLHKHLASQKSMYEETYILQEILGPRQETPLLDKRATAEELEGLEAKARWKDAILEDWDTPPGSPWERAKDTTYDTTSLSWETDETNNETTSLSWDTEGITFDTPPTSWDEGEESTKEKEEPWANRTSTGETESDDSLPDLVSDDTEEEDDGFMFLNTPPSTKERERLRRK